jgi:hypothetical protein
MHYHQSDYDLFNIICVLFEYLKMLVNFIKAHEMDIKPQNGENTLVLWRKFLQFI